MAVVAAGVALVAGLAGPAAYAVQTASQPHTGSIPTAGPAVSGGVGRAVVVVRVAASAAVTVAARSQAADSRVADSRVALPAPALGPAPGTGTGGTIGGTPGQPGGGFGGFGGGRPGGMGGLLDAATVSSAMKALLLSRTPSEYTWVAAAVGSQNASGYQLATRRAGDGRSAASTAATRRRRWPSSSSTWPQGKIHYFIGGGGAAARSMGGSSDSSAIAQWVQAELHRQDGRQHHGLRPDQPESLTVHRSGQSPQAAPHGEPPAAVVVPTTLTHAAKARARLTHARLPRGRLA